MNVSSPSAAIYLENMGTIAKHVFSGSTDRFDYPEIVKKTAEAIPGPRDAIRAVNEGAFGSLQKTVRDLWGADLDNTQSGINQPELVTADVSGVGGVILRRTGQTGIIVTELDVRVCLLDSRATTLQAVVIGSVPTQRMIKDHFNNVSPNLGYDTCFMLCRMALGDFIGRALHNNHD